MHELLQSQICSPFLYKLLILVESIQFLYYSIHPNFNFFFTTVFFEYFQQLIQYFQVKTKNYIIFKEFIKKKKQKKKKIIKKK